MHCKVFDVVYLDGFIYIVKNTFSCLYLFWLFSIFIFVCSCISKRVSLSVSCLSWLHYLSHTFHELLGLLYQQQVWSKCADKFLSVYCYLRKYRENAVFTCLLFMHLVGG